MNNEFKNIDDNTFEQLLASAMPVPDGELVSYITPFKTAMMKTVVGLALSLISLNIGFLNLLLPAVGAVLLFMGLKALRKENKWFYASFAASALSMLLMSFVLLINSTVYAGIFSSVFSLLTYINIGLHFLLLFFLSLALHNVFRKADIDYNKSYSILSIVWYAVICFLAFINYTGIIVPAVMIISYVFILRSLYKLSASLEEAGFVIELASPKISDKAITIVFSAVLLTATVCGYVFFSQYEMNWEPYTPSVSEEAEVIKENLISLGFPEHILSDLKEEELLSLKNAEQVVSETKDHPINKGRKVTETRNESGTTTYQFTSTVYDVKELRITGIAVKLPSEKERWKIIQHFEWVEDPKYFGTESIQLWTADKKDAGWHTASEITGQLLYSKDGKDYVSPYYSIENESYVSESIFGTNHQSDVFLEFSLPTEGERQRGYVAYEIESNDDSYIVDEWINYTHQCSPLQYPVMTAKQRRMKDSWNKSGAFLTVQDAIQF